MLPAGIEPGSVVTKMGHEEPWPCDPCPRDPWVEDAPPEMEHDVSNVKTISISCFSQQAMNTGVHMT